MTTRLSVNINDETADALRALAELHGVSITETVRQAVSVFKYLDERIAKGHHIGVYDPITGRHNRVEFDHGEGRG